MMEPELFTIEPGAGSLDAYSHLGDIGRKATLPDCGIGSVRRPLGNVLGSGWLDHQTNLVEPWRRL